MSSLRSLVLALTAVALGVVALFAVPGAASALTGPASVSAPALDRPADDRPAARAASVGAEYERGDLQPSRALGKSWCRIGSVVYECASMPECTPARDGDVINASGNQWRCGLYQGYWAWRALNGCFTHSVDGEPVRAAFTRGSHALAC
ncbi:hypothetical protein JNUCC64_13785 [Streptomyces sp. JNUCC 64]